MLSKGTSQAEYHGDLCLLASSRQMTCLDLMLLLTAAMLFPVHQSQ